LSSINAMWISDVVFPVISALISQKFFQIEFMVNKDKAHYVHL